MRQGNRWPAAKCRMLPESGAVGALGPGRSPGKLLSLLEPCPLLGRMRQTAVQNLRTGGPRAQWGWTPSGLQPAGLRPAPECRQQGYEAHKGRADLAPWTPWGSKDSLKWKNGYSSFQRKRKQKTLDHRVISGGTSKQTPWRHFLWACPVWLCLDSGSQPLSCGPVGCREEGESLLLSHHSLTGLGGP